MRSSSGTVRTVAFLDSNAKKLFTIRQVVLEPCQYIAAEADLTDDS